MSAAHTPGPWSNSNYDIYGPDKEDGSRCVIASLCFSKKAPDTGQVGNARLIAAAPELLEACRAAAESLRKGINEPRALALLCDAIFKATGAAT